MYCIRKLILVDIIFVYNREKYRMYIESFIEVYLYVCGVMIEIYVLINICNVGVCFLFVIIEKGLCSYFVILWVKFI